MKMCISVEHARATDLQKEILFDEESGDCIGINHCFGNGIF